MYSIGDLSRQTGVKVPTIRYYEQMGLLEAAGRTEGNQRRYDAAHLDRLGFIKHARDLGFTLEAVRELIDLSGHPERPCTHADEIAARQLDIVRDKIARLQRAGKRTGPHGRHLSRRSREGLLRDPLAGQSRDVQHRSLTPALLRYRSRKKLRCSP